MLWKCTRTNENKKRCAATVTTKLIDGHVMMRVQNQNHNHN